MEGIVVNGSKAAPPAVGEGDPDRTWKYFERADLHKLSAVVAVSFVLMTDRGKLAAQRLLRAKIQPSPTFELSVAGRPSRGYAKTPCRR
jgi:hypothetical protein